MKKLLLAIPLVAGASWAGATFYTGSQTQSAYDKLLVQLNDYKPFTLVNESYTSGLVSSRAITKVMDSSAPDAQVLFRLQHDIQHSPIGVNEGNLRVSAANIKTTLVRDQSIPESVSQFMEGFTDAEPVQINTAVGFDGKTVNQFLISAYEHDYEDVQVRFNGVDYTANVDGDVFIGEGTVGELVVSGDDGQMRLSPGKIATNLTRIGKHVFSGSYGVEFDKLSIDANDMPFDIALQEIALTSDSDVDNDSLNTAAKFAIGNIDAPIPLNSASLEVALDRLSIAGMQDYVDAISQISLTSAAMGSDVDDLQVVLDAYKSLITPGLGLNYTIKATNDGGDAELAYGLNVIEKTSPHFPAGGLTSVETVRDALNIIELNARLDADAAALDMTPAAMFLLSPQAQQVIVSDGVSYKADVQLSNLIVNINGNPMSLELMIGEMLDTPLSALGSI